MVLIYTFKPSLYFLKPVLINNKLHMSIPIKPYNLKAESFSFCFVSLKPVLINNKLHMSIPIKPYNLNAESFLFCFVSY